MTATIEAPEKLMTIEEYFAFEEKSLERHEYQNGKLITMAGGTFYHSIIAAQIIVALKMALKLLGKPNAVFTGDARIYLPASNSFVYADTGVAKMPPEFSPHKKGALANPLLIVEVLSGSTERADRGEKFEKYKTLPSFREYLLVSQNEPKIEVFYRENGDSDWWQIKTYRGLETSVPLQSIDCQIDLADVYDGIDFDVEESNLPGEADLK